jgi:hypothetical protein
MFDCVQCDVFSVNSFAFVGFVSSVMNAKASNMRNTADRIGKYACFEVHLASSVNCNK